MSSQAKHSSGSSGRKWKVALVHSSTSGTSSMSSLRCALYLALCLQHSQVAEVTLVSETRYSGSTVDLSYLPPSGELCKRSNDSFDTLRVQDLASMDPDLVLLVLNPGEMERYAELIIAALETSRRRVRIIALLRGVHEDFVLSDRLLTGDKGVTVNGLLGFDVIEDPLTGVLTPSLPNGSIALERLTKENVKEMDSPTRVIEATGVRVLYRKGLSSYTYGLQIYELIYAFNMLFGGTARQMLERAEHRRLVAYAAHEVLLCLRLASRRSESWKASLYTVSYLSPELFEVVMASPYFIYWLVRRTQLLPVSELPAAGQTDLSQGREPTAVWNLLNILKIADAYDAQMPLCKALLTQLQDMQRSKRMATMSDESLRKLLNLIPEDYTLYNIAVPRWAQVYIFRLGLAFVVLIVAVIIPLLVVSK